jgi:predicted HAD superfamily hydrolase
MILFFGELMEIENFLVKSISDMSGVKVYSFDFFDTLVNRRAGHYNNFYIQLYKHFKNHGNIVESLSVEEFLRIRIVSEKIARDLKQSNEGHAEIKIYEIYDVLNSKYGCFLLSDARELSAIEAEFDAINCIPNDDLVRFINCNEGVNIIVSDTFYNEVQLLRFCQIAGINRDVRIYASCDYNMGKYSTLFSQVVADFTAIGFEPCEILHVGDNYHSDVVMPSNYGILSTHIPFGDSRFWNIESVANKLKFALSDSFNYQSACLSSTRSIIARSLSRNKKYSFDKDDYYNYGYTLIGPIVTSFLYWMHYKTDLSGVDHICFMMREGEILRKVYNLLPLNQKSSSELYISRKIVKQARLNNVDEIELKRFFYPGTGQSVRSFLDSIAPGITNKEIFKSFLGLLIEDEFFNVLKLINSSKEIQSIIINNARNTKYNLLEHLRKTVPKSAKKIALIDVGWNGSIQRDLEVVIKDYESLMVEGYYFSTTPGVVGDEPLKAYGFLFDGGHPFNTHNLFMRSPEIIEQCLTSPSMGSLTEYHNGEPVNDVNNLPQLQLSQINEVQNGIIDFAILTSESGQQFLSSVNDSDERNWLRFWMLRMICSPLCSEIDLFRDWVHDDNLINNDCNYVIPRNNFNLLKFCPSSKLPSIGMHDAYWLYACLTLDQRGNVGTFLDIILQPMPIETNLFLVDENDCKNIKISSYYGKFNTIIFEIRQEFFGKKFRFSGLPVGAMFNLKGVYAVKNGNHKVIVDNNINQLDGFSDVIRFGNYNSVGDSIFFGKKTIVNVIGSGRCEFFKIILLPSGVFI